MNHSKLSHFAILLSAIALIAGCTTTTNVTDVQTMSTGKIEGSVQLVEMDCSPSASSAGATVALLGTNYATQSDSNGNWVLDSIPAGYYTIHISKPGFEEYFDGLFPFVGGGTDIFARGLTLARIRTWKVTLSPVAVRRSIFIAPNYMDTSFPCSDTPTVVDSARNDYSSTANLYYFVGRHPTVNSVDKSDWVNFGNDPGIIYPKLGNPNEHSGDTLYLVAYVATCNNAVSYDYYSGDTLKSVFSGLGPPSNVVKIVLP